MRQRPGRHRRWVGTAALCAALSGGCLGGQPEVYSVVANGAGNGQPAWSPDGEELLYVSNHSGTWQVWLVDIRTSATRQLTRDAGPVGGPRWSPDGTEIWYYAQTDSGFALRVTDRTGSVPRTVPTPLGDAFRPSLDPTGTRLLFDGVAPGGGNHDLYVRDLRTDSLRQLTTNPGYDSDGRWSPDGTWIAFHSDRGADPHAVQVYRMRVDGTDQEALTSGPAIHGYPVWSPSGTCLAYTEEVGEERRLRVLHLATREQFALPRHGLVMGDPVFHPDGRRLAFMVRTASGDELALLTLPASVREACAGSAG